MDVSTRSTSRQRFRSKGSDRSRLPVAAKTLNPVLVIISLVFWFWMWGIPGAILSVPMLAIAKIICDRVRPLAAFGHFLEG
jgi:predicted PurR-regulated permease PerM